MKIILNAQRFHIGVEIANCSFLQLAMRNAIESSFNETTLADAAGDDDDAKKKVFNQSLMNQT